MKGPVLRDFVIKKNKFCCKADLAWALRSRNSIPVLTKMTWTICITNIALPENSIQKSLDTLIIVLQNKRVHEYWIRQSTSVPPLKHKLCVHCDRKREMRVFEYSIIGTIPHRSLKANKTVQLFKTLISRCYNPVFTQSAINFPLFLSPVVLTKLLACVNFVAISCFLDWLITF